MLSAAMALAQSKNVPDVAAAAKMLDSQRYVEGIEALKRLEKRYPDDFQIEELLGIAYGAISQDMKALVHLQAAVRLNTNSGVARTNLAKTLSRLGQTRPAGEEFRKALELEPNDYVTNHNLGEFYLAAGQLQQGASLLKRAQEIKPTAYDNGYDFAMAELMTGQLDAARSEVQTLLEQRNTGELHNLLAHIDEKDHSYVAAANEFETAAHMDPSEDNLFDWGGELLLHRTYEPAIDVFRAASERYPKSPRMLIGLGAALYSRGLYEDAVKALLAAADLDPSDQRCYLFLSKAYQSSPTQADEVIQRFKRYAQLQPNNAMAQYYYAMSLWKGRQSEGSDLDTHQVEALLKRSIALNGSMAESHLELGNLYADQREYQQSIPEYQRALQLNRNLPDAHYRLGTDYVHLGRKEQAQTEFSIYQKLRAEHLSDMDKQRADVQQFIYASQGGTDVAGNTNKP